MNLINTIYLVTGTILSTCGIIIVMMNVMNKFYFRRDEGRELQIYQVRIQEDLKEIKTILLQERNK